MAQDGLFKVEIEPDDDDAYGAPTKVGPMSKAAVEKLMREADASHIVVSEAQPELHPISKSGTRPRVAIRKISPPATTIPVLHDDDDEDGSLEPTRCTNRAAPTEPMPVARRDSTSIVAAMVAEALEDGHPPNAVEPRRDTARLPPPMPTHEAVVTFPDEPATTPKRARPALAFPDWVAGPPAYASPPQPTRLPGRGVVVCALAGASVALAALVGTSLWWVFFH